MNAFDRAMALSDPPVEQVAVPYEGTQIPAYLIRAVGHENDVRPLVLAGTGWDATVTETYFGFGLAAAQRGYHVLMHDGPGQGKLLIDEGLPLRHDWEHVITAVVNAAETIDVADQSRIVCEAWSLGGYLAPRAASYEHRLAACIADPGEYELFSGMKPLCHALGLSAENVARLPELDPEDEALLMRAIDSERGLAWKISKRGFWTNGTPNLQSWLEEMTKWTVADCAAQITCPTLVTVADDDPAGVGAQTLYDALTCPKQLLHFSAADGAGMHCEMMNRSLLNRRVFDWLDETLAK
jgi:alpha-beta hydrolase superfamily lysophospholipase